MELFKTHLNPKTLSLTAAVFTVLWYLVAIIHGLNENAIGHENLLETLLFGFQWLTIGSFILGLVESFIIGLVSGWVFASLYNYFGKIVD